MNTTARLGEKQNDPRQTVRLPRLLWICLVTILAVGPDVFTAPELTDKALSDAVSAGEIVQMSSGLRVRIRLGRDLELEVLAGVDDDYASIAERVTVDRDQAPAVSAWNGDRPVAAGDWVRVHLDLLSVDYRSLVLMNLFPEDRLETQGWVHIAQSGVLPTYDEGLWQVAVWFTGSGQSFDELLRANGLTSPELTAGQRILIPTALVHPAFAQRPVSTDGNLQYASDTYGPYAFYRLQAGEALYSAVVVRYTGRTSSLDVQELAEMVQRRSGILDPRDIPVGFPIKIPLELLEPQFLPEGHPRRLEAEAARSEVAQALAQQPAKGTPGSLDGMLIILDAGHGGKDLGTQNNGVWEHDYVYDVTCRLKQTLERETGAKVVMTLKDTQTGFAPSSGDKLDKNLQGTVLTHPPFLAKKNGEARTGVNLRWYLSNSIHRQAVKDGFDPDRIVFISLHADSRHHSLRGVMVYVPGAGYRTKTYGYNSPTYSGYREVREKPFVKFSKANRNRSEALSHKLAEAIVESFKDDKLPVQHYQPIRNRIIRGKQRYVPAVLKANTVRHKVLVEMVNLANAEDAALLAKARDRQRIATSLSNALQSYFGTSP